MLGFACINRRLGSVCGVLFCAMLFGALAMSLLTAVESHAAPATMTQFWAGEAYFTYVSHFKTPTPPPFSRFDAWNIDQAVIADAGDTWYMFHRELFAVADESSCPDGGHRSRIVVRTSTDKGLTWSRQDSIVEPGADACQLTDGDVYYDKSQNQWHALYQCLQPRAAGGQWAICHSYKIGSDPLGAWMENPNNPVVENGEFYDQLGYPELFDEGTPDIVQKNADGSFTVTIHGMEDIGAHRYGYRAVAKVSNNFTLWEPINSGPIFSAADTAAWQVPWEFALRGGGFASTLKEGATYYMIIESSDKQAFIAPDQNWAFGLMRSTSPARIGWQNAAKNPIISSKRRPDLGDSNGLGAVTYPRLFKDKDGVIYLMYGADRVTDGDGIDPVSGHYLFKLTKNAPLLDFTFRAGPRGSDPYFVRTDTVSRGRGDALGYGVTLFSTSDGTHAVRFNRSNARIELSGNPYLMTEAGFRMVLDVTIDGLPGGGNRSARIAGQPGSFWLELYQDADLCFWAVANGSRPEAACLDVSNLIGKTVDLTAIYDRPTGELTLSVNSQEQTILLPQGAALVGDGKTFLIGSAGADGGGYNASPNMTLRRLRFYDQATETDKWSPGESDVNGDGYADLVTNYYGTAYVYLGTPTGAFKRSVASFRGTLNSALFDGRGHWAADVTDVNGDGYADLVTVHSNGNAYVYPGTAQSRFSGGVASFRGTMNSAMYDGTGHEIIGVADVTGDGRGDLVTVYKDSAYVYPGTANSSFAAGVSSFKGTLDSAYFDGKGHWLADVADVTGDGHADLVSVHHNGYAYVWPGTASGRFGGAVASFRGSMNSAMHDGRGHEVIGLGDVNGDGRADLVTVYKRSAYVYPGTSTGAFGGGVASFRGTLDSSLFDEKGHELIAVIDVTGDGHADLVSSHTNGNAYVWPGLANGQFGGAVSSFTGTLNSSQHDGRGHEFVMEKKMVRRNGCWSDGCIP